MTFPLDRSAQLKISNPEFQKIVRQFFREKIQTDGSDRSAQLLNLENKNAVAEIFARENGIFSGRAELEFILHEEKFAVEFFKTDGEKFSAGEKLLKIKSSAQKILQWERTILNFLARISGIATATKNARKLLPTGVKLAATRKTLWDFFDKKAVAIGGGLTHRLNLSDAILIKENHLNFESIPQILRKISPGNFGAFWEIEVETEKQFQQVWENLPHARPGGILFDNFDPDAISGILKKVQKVPGIFFEASGGVNLKNLEKFANSGVDVVSAGFLTKNSAAIDLTLQVSRDEFLVN